MRDRLGRMLQVVLWSCVPIASAMAYPKPSMTNWAPFGITVWFHYSVCSTAKFHVPAARDDGKGGTIPGHANGGSANACLLTKITTSNDPGSNVPVDVYLSSGTGYRDFVISPAKEDGTEWWIVASRNWHNPVQGTAGMSPGFAITNKTKWPVAVSLGQVGCLYHDVLKPGESMNRSTGAVWFTAWAKIVPDGKDPDNDLSCAAPIVSVTTAVLMGFATGGIAEWAGLTAAATTEQVGAAWSILIPSSAVKSGASSIALQGGSLAAQNILKTLVAHQWVQHAGQYAGPPWPFRCAQKPMYDITGGWGTTKVDADGNLTIDTGSPLLLTKVSTCGNNMMQ